MKAKIRRHRHPFRFKLENGKVITAWAKVSPARKPVSITLDENHARKAISMGGGGNTQLCAMSVCSQAHGDAFPHPFEFVDWLYRRAYFVDKTKDGMPTHCIVYEHNDGVAPLFDKDMKKLLATLVKNGPRTINLYPPKHQARLAGRPRGKNTGERKRPVQPRGAALRFARLRLGGVPSAA